MLIEAGFDIAFECPAQTPMPLQLDVHPSRDADVRHGLLPRSGCRDLGSFGRPISSRPRLSKPRIALRLPSDENS